MGRARCSVRRISRCRSRSWPRRRRSRFVESTAFNIGGFDVSALSLTHPGGSFAYRIHGATGDLVYATDHEFGNDEADENLAAFALNAGGGGARRALHAR